MGRGKKRKFDPTIPKHIDQEALPKGVYWQADGRGRWRLQVMKEGKWTLETIADASITLSELHHIVEEHKGGASTGTVAWMLEKFHASSEFKELADDTHTDYENCRKVIENAPTKRGPKLGTFQAARLTATNWQSFHEAIVKQGTPSKANHCIRYVRRVYEWANPHLGIKGNPARPVILTKERKQHKMPKAEVFAKVVEFARERGQYTPHTRGSCPPYLAPLIGLTYAMRLRRVEVVFLTDAHGVEEGILAIRAKGSEDNITEWTPSLRALWEEAKAVRAAILARPRHSKRPVPLSPDDRPIFINEDALPLTRGVVTTAVRRLVKLAIKEGVIAEADAFTLHGVKHRAITDSKNKGAAGHKTEQMRRHYDHEVKVVKPTGDEAEITEVNYRGKEKGATPDA